MYPNNNCSDCSDCPEVIVPLPLPDLTGLCGDTYNLGCVIYTGDPITCLGITTGMTMLEILDIFTQASENCDCCSKVPQDCVVSDWSDWGPCSCVGSSPAVCTQTRTRTIITPPLNSGNLCPSLIETRDCIFNDVCFTFGTKVCGTTIGANQTTPTLSGLHNGKPFYEFTMCAIPYFIWWETTDSLWHCSVLHNDFTVDITDQVLDNDDNYYPISNNTTQLWQNLTDQLVFLMSTNLGTCPPVNICFKLVIQGADYPFTMYYNTSANETDFGSGNYPYYNFNIVVEAVNYSIRLIYDPGNLRWFAVEGSTLGIIGYLNTTNFLPIGTWIPNPANPDNYMVDSVLSDTCTVPPDVDCEVTWSAFGPCGPGGTQDSFGTIVTPSSGNGIPCPTSLIQTQDCAFPFCTPPSNVVVSISGINLTVTFTGVSGASTYDVVYSTDGGANYTTINTAASPVSFPYVCDVTYTGYVVTHCSNGLTSNQVPFTIDVPACPSGPLCGPLLEPFVSGVNTSGVYTFKINNDGLYNNLSPNTVWSTNGLVWTEKLTATGFFIGGRFTQLPTGVFRKGLAKLTCNGFSDPSFVVTSGFLEYSSSQTSGGTVFTIDIDESLGRLYVGGNFSSWNGVPCNNLVCLDFFGSVVTGFNIGTGCRNGGTSTPYPNADVYSIVVQPDGKVLVGGQFTSYNGVPFAGLVRLNSDGTVDGSFVQAAGLVKTFGNVVVNDIKLDSSNRIYVAGYFDTYQGISSVGLVRILSNGAIDSSFNIGTKFGFPASKIIKKVLIVGTKVYVGGFFTSYNGTAVKYLIRLNIADATLDPTFLLNTSVAPGTAVLDIKEAYNGNILIVGDLQGYRAATNKFYFILDATTCEVISTTYPTFPAGVVQLIHIGIV